jgi:outer membrane protein TolC
MKRDTKKAVSVNRTRYLRIPGSLLVLALLIFSTGCSARVSRVEHAGSFQDQLSDKTIGILPDHPLGLSDCIDISLTNNLSLQALEIQKRLATLDRKIAFGNFLPNIELQFSFSATDKPQLRETESGLFQLSDQEVARVAVEAQQPIFLPQAWFLYDVRQKGEDISNLVLQRTRQLISLQVTTLYFACLSLEEAEDYLEKATGTTEVLLKDIQAFEREGLVMPSERKQVETLLLQDRLSLENVRRISKEIRGDLLEAMGLSPFAEIELREETPFVHPETTSLSEDVLEALLNRLELHMDDRTLEIRKQEIRNAIASFLPQIVGLGSFSYSSDSFLKYSNVWSYGVSMVMSIFDGFQNVFGYRAAREREKEAFIKREQTCMMIMLEVLKARHRVEQVTGVLRVAEKNLETAEESHREARAQWNEGLISLSELLEVVTKRDQARFLLSTARFQHQVALATLSDVLGRTKKEP